MSETPHILIVDDDSRIRGLLKKYLSRNDYVVSEARDSAHARKLLDGLIFDLIVIDVMMPGEDGFALTKGLRQTMDTPVMLLTAKGDAEDRIAGLECGADDYLAKPFEPRELLLRISAILRRSGEPVVEAAEAELPRMLSLGQCRYDVNRGELWKGQDPVRLTTAESALMRLLARQAGEPVSRSDLLAEVGGGEEPSAQERAIDVQVTRLRRKIEESPRVPRYLQTVRGAGYMLAPD